MHWTFLDFFISGLLILLVSFIMISTLKSKIEEKRKIFVGIVIFLIFLTIWAELAVGLFNSPLAGD